MWHGNIVEEMLDLICWAIIVSAVVSTYKKQQIKATPGKIIIALFVGLFSFSITTTYFNAPLQIAILPLGVWLLYAVLTRRGSWQTYRGYAWLGFFANYLFLVTALIAAPLHEAVYTVDELKTYVADWQEATVVLIHETASWPVLLVADAPSIAEQASEGQMESNTWHYDTLTEEKGTQQERFPYLLIGTDARRGSGYTPTIYIEKDGRGLLVTTEKRHIYFRTQQPILRGEGIQ